MDSEPVNVYKTFNNLDKQKQDRIFNAAVREFSEWGYAGASINTMVENLGIAKGSIFQYFGNKEGLFNFVFSKALFMVKGHLRNVRDKTKEQDFFTRLEAIIFSGTELIQRHPRIYALYTKVRFERKIGFSAHLLASLKQESFKFLTELLEEGIARGELRPDLNISAAVFIIDALLDRFLQAYMIERIDTGKGRGNIDKKEIKKRAGEMAGILQRGFASGG